MLLYEVLSGTISTRSVKDNLTSDCLWGGIKQKREYDNGLGFKRGLWTTSCGKEWIALTGGVFEAHRGLNSANNANVNLTLPKQEGYSGFPT